METSLFLKILELEKILQRPNLPPESRVYSTTTAPQGFVLTLLLVWFADAGANNGYRVFNVKKFGAVSDGKTESSKAFLKAWTEACRWHGRAMVLIPGGVYILDSVLFLGECNGYMAFILKGVLKPKRSLQTRDQWITFRYIKGFLLGGGGTLDGEGYKYWNRSDCLRNHNCHPLAISLRLEFIQNGRVSHIRSINSQNAHVSLFGCVNLNMSNLRLSAPGDSPNTDGIKIGSSEEIQISKTRIGTGDDCVAILSGSKNIHISQVQCGPGHGISVGSMGGKGSLTESVVGVTVRDCTFNGTSDGARIKTWASSTTGFASNFIYENIRMMNVGNPIIIDQDYCPYPPCDMKNPSRIQIKDITFNNIWGTSESDVAVTLNCSRTVPCKNIRLKTSICSMVVEVL
ncbi:exopolygalacturonase [Salix suchowensis]|nr:exopolygalacturonase [Salix suchowensis]